MPYKTVGVDAIRGGLRRLGYAKRRSSFPFVSGDTYASMSDFIYSGEHTLDEYRLKELNSRSFKLFLPAQLKTSFMAELVNSPIDFSKARLLIHNYDNIPTTAEMEMLSHKFQNVFSVNWLGDKEIASPIPIGLENWGHLRNGVPHDFSRIINRGLPDFRNRSINLLSSFSLSSNVKERAEALEFLNNYSSKKQMENFTSPRKYREMVSNSKFVISPPGNGPDCHRTWEAIYLGAIPIVLQKHWPFGEMDLPVITVNAWSEIPDAIHSFEAREPLGVQHLRELFLDPFSS